LVGFASGPSRGPPRRLGACGRGRQNLNDGITALETHLSKQEQDRTVAAEELRRRETVIIDLITYAARDRAGPVGMIDRSAHPGPRRSRSAGRGTRFRDRLEVLAANPNKKERSVRFSDSVTTIRLDDTTSLVELQRAQLEQQDQHLDVLSASVSRTKELATSISEELDAQAGLIDELDTKVERTNTRMNSATRRVQQVMTSVKRDRGTQMVLCLVVLIVILIIVIIVVKA